VLGTLAALCNAEGTGSCRAAPAFRTPRKNMCRSAEAPEPGVAYRGRFEAALYCQIPRSAAFIAHRKGCAVRRMRVGLAPPILVVRPGGPLCADRVPVRFSSLTAASVLPLYPARPWLRRPWRVYLGAGRAHQ
jgi:hypothetical protein